jgi:hypothetical protein
VAPRGRAPAGRTWLGGLGAIVVTVSLGWVAGPLGLFAGGIVAVAWYLLPVPYAVAGGHVIALPLVGTPDLGVLVTLEAGFLTILAAPMVRDSNPPRSVGLLSAIAIALGAVAWLGWATWEPRWLVGLAVVGLVGLGLYGVHRYAVVSLELQGAESRA